MEHNVVKSDFEKRLETIGCSVRRTQPAVKPGALLTSHPSGAGPYRLLSAVLPSATVTPCANRRNII